MEAYTFEELLTYTQEMWQNVVDGNYENKMEGINKALENFFFIELRRRTDSEPADQEIWEHWVSDTAPLVERCLSRISIRIDSMMLDYQIEWVNDDWQAWQELCWWRSTLTFLKEVYREELDEEDLDRINLAQIDDFLKGIGGEGNMPEHLIPKGMPKTHWWWWYPSIEAT